MSAWYLILFVLVALSHLEEKKKGKIMFCSKLCLLRKDVFFPPQFNWNVEGTFALGTHPVLLSLYLHFIRFQFTKA